ncbi:MAG TPA: hypothetical protein VK461_12900 [Acidimicrobiales bacterium]|nr:hypothetical protein [Acidimicrobiales bacterium]
MSTRRHLVSLLVVTAACFVGASCGGSDDSSSPTASSASAAADSGSSDQGGAAATEAQQSDTQKGSASGDIPTLSDGAWEGTVHVKVSGDVDATFDAPGGGITQGGTSIMTFASDEAATKASQIALSPEGSSVFVTVDAVSVGGNVGEQCSVSASTNSDAKAVVDFSCNGVEGVSTKDLKSHVVDIEGTFEVTRPA